MKIPTVAEADKLLNEAEKLNPGRWVAHKSKFRLCLCSRFAPRYRQTAGHYGYEVYFLQL